MTEGTCSSFTELCLPLRAELVGHVSRMSGGRRDVAEDVVQEAYIHALNAWPRFKLPDGYQGDPAHWARAWMFRIVTHLYLDARRNARTRERNYANYADTCEQQVAAVEVANLDGDEFSPEVSRALRFLEPKFAEVIKLYYVHEKSFEEIAQAQGTTSRATVRVRLHRARREIRSHVEAYARSEYGYGVTPVTPRRCSSDVAVVAEADESPEVVEADTDRVDSVVGRDDSWQFFGAEEPSHAQPAL